MNKTLSGAKKRFRITRKGKVLHKKACKSHLLRKKSASRKRRLNRKQSLGKSDARKVLSVLSS